MEILHEEQERIVKIETIKKSLEVEVKVSARSHLYFFIVQRDSCGLNFVIHSNLASNFLFVIFAFEKQNLSIRLEEVEANAVVGAKRIISKLEARIRDLELELEEEKRRHAETIKILRKKERTVKEVLIQCEEDQKNVILLQESLEKTNAKVNLYKRQLTEQVNPFVATISCH